jgi:tRNA dimethylallyltransferase
VLVVAGPTASGKSTLALAAARAFDGVVINADAMQVYRELTILTARPGPEDLALAPHRLYGVLPGAEACSAGRWRTLAVAEIEAARAAGRLPMVVGGTGLYLRALAQGLAALPEVSAAARAAARARHRSLGGAAFHAALAARDPVMAARLRPGDSQRLIRAWEVLEATGRSLADWQAEATPTPPPYRFLCLAFVPRSAPARAALYAACDRRLRAMVEAGALGELSALLDLGLDPGLPVMKALGVPELAAHLRGEQTLEQAVTAAQQATRRYAKRQLTWLRTQLPRDFIGNENALITFEAQYSASLDNEIFANIRDSVLTPPG